MEVSSAIRIGEKTGKKTIQLLQNSLKPILNNNYYLDVEYRK